MKCPQCKGIGIVINPTLLVPKDKESKVEFLLKEGFSFRQVCKIMGYKSPNSITRLLTKYNK